MLPIAVSRRQTCEDISGVKRSLWLSSPHEIQGKSTRKTQPAFLGVNLPETTAVHVISHITAHQVSAEENCSVCDYLQ